MDFNKPSLLKRVADQFPERQPSWLIGQPGIQPVQFNSANAKIQKHEKTNSGKVKKEIAAETLRQKAEVLLKKKSFKTTSLQSEADTLQIIHELQVHQIELEMQNEELSRAEVKADTAVRKYTELYDFAPSGYFTLSKEGKIVELNLKGASMLGEERQRLLNSMFRNYLSHDNLKNGNDENHRYRISGNRNYWNSYIWHSGF